MKKLLLFTSFFVSISLLAQNSSQTNSTNYNIPDGNSTSDSGTQYSSVTFSGIVSGSTITNVVYETDVYHTYHDDLGARISTNFNGTSSPSQLLYSAGTQGAYTGTLTKDGSTSTFNGMNPNQTFYFRVWDTASGDTGYIDWFKITVYYSTPNPNAPIGMSASAQSSSSIYVNWNNVSGASQYRLYHSTSYSGSYSQIYSGSTSSYTNNSGLNSGTTYYYKAKACSSSSSSSCSSNYSSIVSATTDEIVPNPPTNVNAGIGGSTAEQVVVGWSYVTGYSSYNIYRSNTGPTGTYNYIDTKNGVTNSSNAKFTDNNGIQPETEYCYKVKTCASNSNCSSYSTNDCYTTTSLPPPPKYSISGTITASGSGLANALVNFAGYSATTNNSGYYIINDVLNTNSYLVPSKAGYDFTPNNIHISYIDSNITNQNFTATSNTINAPNVTATATDPDAILLEWNSVSGANYYKIFFSNGNEYTGFITSTSQYVTGLTTNQQACLYVKAYQNNNGSGLISPNSNTACATPVNTLPEPTVSLSSPNTGTFFTNNSMTVSWSSTNQHHYGIYLYKGGEAESNQIGNIILLGNSSATSYNWDIPTTLNGHSIDGNDYKIKIVVWNSGDASVATAVGDYSSNYLTITPNSSNLPTVTLTYPTNSETFNVGEMINIQWNSTNQALFGLYLYEGGTGESNKIAVIHQDFNNTSTQNYNWQIPSSVTLGSTTTPLAGVDYKIRVLIKNSDDVEAVDFSNQFFSINVDNGCSFVDDEIEDGSELDNAVTFLCGEGMLEDDNSCQPEEQITRAALAKLAYLSIGLDTNTVTDTVDTYPSPFQDLQDDTTWFYSYAKNLSYLEYGDGKSPFDKTFFNFYASNVISRKYALKVLLETWNATTQNGSTPYTDVDASDENAEYIYTAYQLGVIESATTFNPNEPVLRKDIFVWLYKMMDVLNLSNPTPIIDDFFITGNYTPENFSAYKGLHSGNFNHYTKTSFAISSVGIPLSYEHTYNSYLSEMPKGLSILQPLGKMWNHTYNSYIQEIVGDLENPNDYRVAVSLPNSGFHVYKLENGQYSNTTQGVYNTLLKPTSDKFTITTKNQIVYTYQKLGGTSDDYPFILKTVHDRNGNTLAVNYENSQDANHPYHKRIKEVVGTSGRELQFFYHSNTNKINYIQDPLNRKVYYTYGTDGKLITFKDAKNQTTTYNYGSTFVEEDLLMSIQLPKGNNITNTYEHKKLVSSQTNNNNPTQYVYNRNYGQTSADNYTKATVTSPQGEVSEIDYNKNGNPHHVVKDNNTDVTITYNTTQTSKPSNITIDGKSAGMTYDTMGNVLSVNLPLGVGYSYSYNGNNDITQYTDPRGKNYNYTYNGSGNLTQTTTPRGSTSFTVNSKGLVISVTNPVGISTSYTYDNYGNLTQTSAPEGISTSSNYDIASRLLSFTNPNGVSVNYQYDANDNLLQETFNGHSTSYAFDPNDNLTQITNANGGATTMAYDFDNDFLTSVNFGSATDVYTYFDDGKVHTYTNPNGTTFTYTYDTEGRLITVNNSGGSNISYTYDTHNNIETVTNTNGTITYTYDALNRITSTTDYYNNTVGYTYDANSNVTKITYPGNKVVDYTYYDDNLLHTVKDWNNQTTTYTYRNDGLLTLITYPNGTNCNYTYDDAGRQTAMAWKKADGSVINNYTHTLDAIGNHLSETKTEPFAVSNLTNETINYTHNNTNQLQTANGTSNVSFGYDTNGNTTSKTGNAYTFDKYDNLTSISGNLTAQYQYDGQGNRRKSIINSAEKRYVLDILGMSKVLIETNNTNTAQNYYVYGLGLISRIDANDNTNYYHYDFRGSTVAMTDATEIITHKYEYNDFGQTLQSEEANFNAYRYVGKYGVAYEDTELYFMRARYYDPSVGRFLSEDPIWSTNLYPYADNNPVSLIDANGNFPKALEDPIGYIDGFKSKYEVSTAAVDDKYTTALQAYAKSEVDLIGGSVYSEVGFKTAEVNIFGQKFSAFTGKATAGIKNLTFKAQLKGTALQYKTSADIGIPGFLGLEIYGKAGVGGSVGLSVGADNELKLGIASFGVKFKVIKEKPLLYKIWENAGGNLYEFINE